jgi:hypothetical protein
MKKEQINKLLELIGELVGNTDDNWTEKRALILAECTSDDQTNLEEFCSWFEPIE